MNILFWGLYVAFVAAALAFDTHGPLFGSRTPLAPVRWLVWAVFAAFTAYSVYCSTRENLFRTIRKLAELHWGRQIGTDLYLGLTLFLFVVYLNEGPVVALLWLLPMLAFVNLATLLYLAIHFDQVVSRFV